MAQLKGLNEKVCAALHYESGATAFILYEGGILQRDDVVEWFSGILREAIRKDEVFLSMRSPFRTTFNGKPADHLLLQGLRAVEWPNSFRIIH